MKTFKSSSLPFVVLLLGGILLSTGCGGSKKAAKEKAEKEKAALEAATPVSDVVQKQLDEQKSENASLKQQIAKLREDNVASTARLAGLETQLQDLREQIAAKAEPEPKVKPARNQTVQPPSEAPAESAPTATLKPKTKTATKPKPLASSKTAAVENQTPYENGIELYRAKNYQEAAAVFQSILESKTSTQIYDNCYYWLGECEFGQKKYQEAISHFEKVLTFPQSEKADDAQIMVANCYATIGDKVRAKDEYNKLIANFPSSHFVKTAKLKVSQL